LRGTSGMASPGRTSPLSPGVPAGLDPSRQPMTNGAGDQIRTFTPMSPDGRSGLQVLPEVPAVASSVDKEVDGMATRLPEENLMSIESCQPGEDETAEMFIKRLYEQSQSRTIRALENFEEDIGRKEIDVKNSGDPDELKNSGLQELDFLRTQVSQLCSQAKETQSGQVSDAAKAELESLRTQVALLQAQQKNPVMQSTEFKGAPPPLQQHHQMLPPPQTIPTQQTQFPASPSGLATDEVHSLKAEISDLQYRLRDAQRLAANASASAGSKADSSAEVILLRSQVVDLSKQLDESTRYVSEAGAAKAQVSRLTMQLEEAKSAAMYSASSDSGENRALKAKVAELERNLDQERSRSSASGSQDQADIRSLRTQNEDLRQRLEEAQASRPAGGYASNAETDSLRSQHKDEVSQLKAQSIQLEQRMQDIQQQLSVKEGECTRLRDANSQLEQAARDLECARVREQEETGSAKRANSKAGGAEAQATATRLKEALQQLSVRDKQMTELTNDLDKSRRKVREMNEELAKVGSFLLSNSCKNNNNRAKGNAPKDGGILPGISN